MTRTAHQRTRRKIRDWVREGSVKRHPDTPWIHEVLAPSGLTVYKKVCCSESYLQVVIELTIPFGAIFVWVKDSTEGKCRANKAVVSNKPMDTNLGYAVSNFSWHFTYSPGDTVTPTYPFNLDQETCASGIHFFPCKRDALYYEL